MTPLAPGEFVLVNRFLLEAPLDEWLAVLPDTTEIVIAGDAHGPSAIAMQLASDVISARGQLELQAHRLLATLGTQPVAWRLLTIDFGSAARRAQSAFLMCFVVDTTGPDTFKSGPYVEVAFALEIGEREAEQYRLSIWSTWGELA